MRFDFVGWAVNDVSAAAVGLPAGNARRIMLVSVGDAPVVFFLVLVFLGIRSGIAPQPELFDELLALVIRAQPFPGLPFLVGDDVGDVLIEPFPVRGLQLFAQLIFLSLALLVGHGFGYGFALL